MKSTGIVRNVDDLGRFAIPRELRQIMRFHERGKIEFFVENERIVLKKHQPFGVCLVTGEMLSVNKEYLPGVVLSPKGAAILLEELKKSTMFQTPQEY